MKGQAKSTGCCEVTLNAPKGNAPQKAFYEKMGMKLKKTQVELILKL